MKVWLQVSFTHPFGHVHRIAEVREKIFALWICYIPRQAIIYSSIQTSSGARDTCDKGTEEQGFVFVCKPAPFAACHSTSVPETLLTQLTKCHLINASEWSGRYPSPPLPSQQSFLFLLSPYSILPFRILLRLFILAWERVIIIAIVVACMEKGRKIPLEEKKRSVWSAPQATAKFIMKEKHFWYLTWCPSLSSHSLFLF